VLLCTELFYSPYPFGTASVNALADYWINSTTQRLLALAQDGVVYKSSGGAFSPLTMATVMQDDTGVIVVGGQETGEFGGHNQRKAFVFDNGHSKIQTSRGRDRDDGLRRLEQHDEHPAGLDPGCGREPRCHAASRRSDPQGAVVVLGDPWWSSQHLREQARDHETFKNAVGGQFEYVQAIGVGTGIRNRRLRQLQGHAVRLQVPSRHLLPG